MKSQKILFGNMFEINNFCGFGQFGSIGFMEIKKIKQKERHIQKIEKPFESFSQLDFVCSAISQKYNASKVHTYFPRSLLRNKYFNANNNPRFSHMQILCKYS